MTEEDARLELLKSELSSVHSSIQSLDTIVFQIKGWCVTAALAIGGFAVSSHTPALTLIGAAAVVGFFLVNCQFKMIQRAFIRHNKALAYELRSTGIMQVLRGEGALQIVGAVVPDLRRGVSSGERARSLLSDIWHEARLPNTFSLYLFLFVCLGVEAIILFL